MAKRKDQRLIDQAALQSLVRFGPQLDALTQLSATAKGSYKTAVNAANVSSAATQQAVAQAAPAVGKIYDDAGLSQAGLNGTLLGHDLAGLSGPGTDVIKAAGATEAHMAATHMNEAKVQALQELTNRGLQADAGRAAAVLQAGSTLHDDLAKIGQASQSLAGQAGAFRAATLGDLLDTKAERSFTAHQKALDRANQAAMNTADNVQSDTNSQRTAATSTANTQARIDAAAAKKTKGLLPNGVKRATPQQHGAVKDKVDSTMALAAPYKRIGRHKLGVLLTVGAPAETKKDANGNSVKYAAVPKVSPLVASVALDLMFDGHVSRRNRKELAARGITVAGLGYRGPQTAAQAKSTSDAIGRALQRGRKRGQAVPLF